MRAFVMCGLAALLAVAVGAGAARANDVPKPVGQWLLKFYPDPSLRQSGESAICLRADGSWRALDFPISGNWFLNGDRLRFVGIYPDGVFSAFGGFASGKSVSGEFNDTNRFTLQAFSNGNFEISRTAKSCRAADASQARSIAPGRAYSR